MFSVSCLLPTHFEVVSTHSCIHFADVFKHKTRVIYKIKTILEHETQSFQHNLSCHQSRKQQRSITNNQLTAHYLPSKGQENFPTFCHVFFTQTDMHIWRHKTFGFRLVQITIYYGKFSFPANVQIPVEHTCDESESLGKRPRPRASAVPIPKMKQLLIYKQHGHFVFQMSGSFKQKTDKLVFYWTVWFSKIIFKE